MSQNRDMGHPILTWADGWGIAGNFAAGVEFEEVVG